MGQLYDGTREFRKQRKARRLEKASVAREGSLVQSEGAASRGPPHDSGEDEPELSEDEVDDPLDDLPAAGPGTSSGAREPGRARKKKGPRQLRPMEKDMYKIFDGSALMALGQYPGAPGRYVLTLVPKACSSRNILPTCLSPGSRKDGRRRCWR